MTNNAVKFRKNKFASLNKNYKKGKKRKLSARGSILISHQNIADFNLRCERPPEVKAKVNHSNSVENFFLGKKIYPKIMYE